MAISNAIWSIAYLERAVEPDKDNYFKFKVIKVNDEHEYNLIIGLEKVNISVSRGKKLYLPKHKWSIKQTGGDMQLSPNEDIHEGDTFAMFLTKKGELHFLLNDDDKGAYYLDRKMHDDNVFPFISIMNISIEVEQKQNPWDAPIKHYD